MSLLHRIIDTSFGSMAVVFSPAGVRRVFLPCPSPEQLRKTVFEEFPGVPHLLESVPELADFFTRYFRGERVQCDAVIDWVGYAEFDVTAWRACRSVAYGQTSTYREIAEKIGRPNAARAVGGAMRKNPCPIIVPCHRILKSDGGLGGYSGPGGPQFKRELLNLEAAANEAIARP